MKVITLDRDKFRDACQQLWRLGCEDFPPDLVVGIRTGGFVVAEAMLEGVASPPPLLPITRQRSTTQAKSEQRWIRAFLKRLPRPVTNGLRVVEHRLIAGAKARKKAASLAESPWQPDPAEGADLLEALRSRKEARILLIDDAVDTGSTLKAVIAYLAAADPTANIRTAVIVTTTESPIQTPDVSLYRNVLCRFPWSHDFVG